MDVWSETIERFGDTPRFDDSGSWSIAVDCSMKTIGELLAAAPAGFLSEVSNTPLIDGSAQEVDVEASHGVMTNWKECALILASMTAGAGRSPSTAA